MAKRAGMSAAEREGIVLAGLLHDLGKLAVPNRILDHDGPLSDSDWEVIRRHPDDSGRILRECPELQVIARWAESHHERPDGGGYHLGIEGHQLEFAGALLAAADAFDAMTAERPYRPPLSADEALGRLREGSGTQFAPEAVGLLADVIRADGQPR